MSEGRERRVEGGEVVTATELREGLRAVGARGRVVCLHASLASFGWVNGRGDSVVEAILGEGNTLMVPTFSSGFFMAPRPEGRVIARNAEDDGRMPAAVPERGYAVAGNEIDRDMGAIALAVLERGERVRGDHPLNSFAAVGGRAEEIVGGQKPLAVYAPLVKLVEARGLVMSMGVGLTAVTLVHLAENQAGARLFRRWGVLEGGAVVECENGSCSRGFEALSEVLAPMEVQVRVGGSQWRCWEAGAMLEAVVEAITDNPGMLRCKKVCPRCRDLGAGGPIG